MPFLVTLALKWGLPRGFAKIFGWAVPALVVVALVGGTIAAIYLKGETAGGAKVQVQAEKAHTKAVAESRSDERQAQATVDAIGARVARTDDATTELVRSRMTEIHNDLDATRGSTAGAVSPPPQFDTGGVRDNLNALVADANRAADNADAER